MKKALLILSSLGVLVTLVFALISCGGNDPKPSKAKVSFATATKTVQESAGTVEVKVLLDKAVTTDLVVTYNLSGTATKKAGIVTGDYDITGDAGSVTIPKGETSASIQISIVNDNIFEQDETIDITLTDVTGTEAQVSDTDNECVVTIQSDDPGSVVSFASTTLLTIDESNGLTEVQVQLDNPSPEDITVTYTLSGSAVDSVKAKTNKTYADYAIEGGTPGELVIPAGETTASIEIAIYPDFILEDSDPNTATLDPENIKITLASASGGGATINSNKDEYNISLLQQDGMVVELDWDYTTVDMDLALWVGGDVASEQVIALSAVDNLDANNPSQFEQLFVPKIFIDGAKFSLSYVYYAGDKDPMDFQVLFIDVANQTIEPQANWTTYTASYSANNIHKWVNVSDLTLKEQSFEMVSGDFGNFSSITVPNSQSRMSTGTTTPTTKNFQRQNVIFDRHFQK